MVNKRFWAKVEGDKRFHQCWNWIGCRAGGRNKDYGYFRISNPRMNVYAHRMAYCLFNGIDINEIKGKVIRHKCDNSLCCNPYHLEIGTQFDNVKDMVKRKGSNKTNCKLSINKVKLIKKRIILGEKHSSIASDYNVHRSTISQIARGKNWKDVPW